MSIFSRVFNRFGQSSRHFTGTQFPDPDLSANNTDITVTEDLALQQSSLFACVRLISSLIGTLPLETYRVEGDSRDKAIDLLIYERLKHSPNSIMDGATFWELAGFSLAMHGNFYALISRSGGEIANLWPLSSQQMCVEFDAARNRLMYLYTIDGKQIRYEKSQIFHIRLFGTNTVGFSPLSYAAANIGISAQNSKLAASYARKGGKATGMFKVDKLLNPEERKQIRENIITPLESPEGNSTVLLELGTDYKSIQLNPEQLQLLESRRFSVEDIARIFGVPSILINDSGNSTVWGSGVEQIILGFQKTTLRGYLKKIESAIRNQLFTRTQRQEIVSEFNVDGLLRADSGARATFLSTMVQNGIMTRNEARALENRSPMEGGDALTVQSNLVEVDQLPRLAENGQ